MILYVDDEEPNRVVFEQSFKRSFPVRTASSGSEALELLAGGGISVLVTDQRMPGMSGNELLAIAKEKYPDVIRIVITAYSDLDPILAAVNVGLVARYIVKPWKLDDLHQVLQWALSAHSMGREDRVVQARLIETERLATLGSLNASLLHDMAQPLMFLLNNAEHLVQIATDLREQKKSDAQVLACLREELPEMAKDMLEGTQMLSQLVRDMMAFLGQALNPQNRRADPAAAIRFAMSACRSLPGRREYEGQAALPQVAMGQSELAQVLINLIRNASGALVRDGAHGTRVLVRSAVRESRLVIDVNDDGCGMSADVLDKVGKPFFSGDGEGMGLGFHQCRRIIEGNGGTVAIQSQLGKGTTIQFSLPLVSSL